MSGDERVWLRHGEHEGYFECPAGAVEHWLGMGWRVADGPPEEVNPVVAENLAAQKAAAEQAAADEKAAKAAIKTSSRKSGADSDPQE